MDAVSWKHAGLAFFMCLQAGCVLFPGVPKSLITALVLWSRSAVPAVPHLGSSLCSKECGCFRHLWGCSLALFCTEKNEGHPNSGRPFYLEGRGRQRVWPQRQSVQLPVAERWEGVCHCCLVFKVCGLVADPVICLGKRSNKLLRANVLPVAWKAGLAVWGIRHQSWVYTSF